MSGGEGSRGVRRSWPSPTALGDFGGSASNAFARERFPMFFWRHRVMQRACPNPFDWWVHIRSDIPLCPSKRNVTEPPECVYPTAKPGPRAVACTTVKHAQRNRIDRHSLAESRSAPDSLLQSRDRSARPHARRSRTTLPPDASRERPFDPTAVVPQSRSNFAITLGFRRANVFASPASSQLGTAVTVLG